MGNTCKPMAVSFQCMTKSTTIKKKERKKTANSDVATAIRLDSEFWFSKSPMGKGMMHSSKKTVYFFGNHEISNKLQERSG